MSVPLSEGSQLTVYADDILLYRPITCQGDFIALQEDINILDSWIEANYLQFNISKYKYMVVSWKREGISPASLTLQGHHLECVECFGLLPGPLMLILYAVWQGNCWDYCTNMQSCRSYGTPMGVPVSLVRPHLEYASHSILAEKYQHTRECPEICPQNQLFDIAEHCLNADST